MTIRIIEQTSAERHEETRQLFEKCLPYLQKGESLWSAVQKVTGTTPTNAKNGWYRALIEYSISQGFPYRGRN